MMAYIGSEGSSSGFHRCFSSTVALNLLVESDGRLNAARHWSDAYRVTDRPVICIGTDFESQNQYDTFMSAKGISPHVDWVNLGTDQLTAAEFPLYAYDQKVGDLVVFPPATAHQVWNPATLSTKLVWNILHPLSLEVGFQYVQPPFNRLCHPDVARTNLSLAYAMASLARDDSPGILPPDLPLLSRLFRQMVHDESIENQPATPIILVRLPETVIATCNFCSTAIWNRHVRCTGCVDFDLCLACYLSGRSCEHSQSYSWAEILSTETCNRILVRAREILGFQPEEPRIPDRKKTLGTAVNDLMKARQNQIKRLCHLCRIDHPEWKGRRCDKCTAFFCFRGLFRHFDMNSADVIRHSTLWTCPKCKEICNCRCCHFNTAYVKAEKPASKRRVKPSDSRGKIMGFTDNVFDQKRGQRISTGVELQPLPQISPQKRQVSTSDFESHDSSLRKFEFQTPETEGAPRMPSGYAFTHSTQQQLHMQPPGAGFNGPMLPGITALPQQHAQTTVMQMNTNGTCGHILKTSPSSGSTFAEITASQLSSLPPLTTSPDAAVAQKHASADTMSVLTKVTPAIDGSISECELRIAKLHQYGDELLRLGMEDSHRRLSQEREALEVKLKNLKKQKSATLIESLQSEFPELADVARKEVEKLGYV